MDLTEYRGFLDQQMLRILGQMERPSQIFDYLYLVGREGGEGRGEGGEGWEGGEGRGGEESSEGNGTVTGVLLMIRCPLFYRVLNGMPQTSMN